jgi:hypothetical protein
MMAMQILIARRRVCYIGLVESSKKQLDDLFTMDAAFLRTS